MAVKRENTFIYLSAPVLSSAVTVEDERTKAYSAARDGVTLPAFVPTPPSAASMRPMRSPWGRKSFRHRRDMRESRFLKPQIEVCCNALIAVIVEAEQWHPRATNGATLA
jgi:hypothetical protein